MAPIRDLSWGGGELDACDISHPPLGPRSSRGSARLPETLVYFGRTNCHVSGPIPTFACLRLTGRNQATFRPLSEVRERWVLKHNTNFGKWALDRGQKP